MTPNELLKNKLASHNIHVDVSKIVLNASYQSIVDEYELFKFGDLSPIFKSVEVDVAAGLSSDNNQLYIMRRYSWIYTSGGSNGSQVIDSYKINLEEITDGC